MREALLGFIARLREAGVRISVAESIDAAHAMAAAGLERVRLREALAATLVKDEADRPAFDREFDLYFRAGHQSRKRSASAARAGKGWWERTDVLRRAERSRRSENPTHRRGPDKRASSPRHNPKPRRSPPRGNRNAKPTSTATPRRSPVRTINGGHRRGKESRSRNQTIQRLYRSRLRAGAQDAGAAAAPLPGADGTTACGWRDAGGSISGAQFAPGFSAAGR